LQLILHRVQLVDACSRSRMASNIRFVIWAGNSINMKSTIPRLKRKHWHWPRRCGHAVFISGTVQRLCSRITPVAVYQLYGELESETPALEIGVTAVQLGNSSKTRTAEFLTGFFESPGVSWKRPLLGYVLYFRFFVSTCGWGVFGFVYSEFCSWNFVCCLRIGSRRVSSTLGKDSH